MSYNRFARSASFEQDPSRQNYPESLDNGLRSSELDAGCSEFSSPSMQTDYYDFDPGNSGHTMAYQNAQQVSPQGDRMFNFMENRDGHNTGTFHASPSGFIASPGMLQNDTMSSGPFYNPGSHINQLPQAGNAYSHQTQTGYDHLEVPPQATVTYTHSYNNASPYGAGSSQSKNAAYDRSVEERDRNHPSASNSTPSRHRPHRNRIEPDTVSSQFSGARQDQRNVSSNLLPTSSRRQTQPQSQPQPQQFPIVLGSVISTGPGQPMVYRCDHHGCHSRTFGRPTDLQRHHNSAHAQIRQEFWCPHPGCERSRAGGRPFLRSDKVSQHLRQKHAQKQERQMHVQDEGSYDYEEENENEDDDEIEDEEEMDVC